MSIPQVLTEQEKLRHIRQKLDLITGIVLIDELKKGKPDEAMLERVIKRLMGEVQDSISRNIDTIKLSAEGKISALEGAARMSGDTPEGIETLARDHGVSEDDITRGKERSNLTSRIKNNVKL